MMSKTRNRNLLMIIAVLLLTNIAVLGYFLWFEKDSHRGGGQRNGIGEVLEKEVGFTSEQLDKYKVLKEEQKMTIRPMFDEMRKAKENLFGLMSGTATDSLVENAANQIAERQKALDLQTFNYFRNVRMLCTPAQEPRYDSLIMGMFKKMGKPRETEKK